MKPNDNNDEIIEYEKVDYDNEEYSSIITPFDPSKVDIEHKTLTLQNIVSDIQDGYIELHPEFQRNDGIWSLKQKSRLIESLILSIPLPSFYFDVLSDGKMEVVDGLQRLSTIKDFVVLKDNMKGFKLNDLEYLDKFNGLCFGELEPIYKRKILNTNFECYIIKENTPDNVKNSIFTRLNEGGAPLTAAEIKNAMFRGVVSEFIKELSESKQFIKATNSKISKKRMLDREFVNRFFALYFFKDINKEIGYDEMMINALKEIKNKIFNKNKYKCAFLKGMTRSFEILNKNAFRKLEKNGINFSKINRALYDCTSVSFANISDDNWMRINKELFKKKYMELLKNETFVKAISNSTFKIGNIKKRFELFEEILEESYD